MGWQTSRKRLLAFIACNAARSAGRWGSGVVAGVVVAFATVAVFLMLSFLRVDLFSDDLTDRPDWPNTMMRFRASGTFLLEWSRRAIP